VLAKIARAASAIDVYFMGISTLLNIRIMYFMRTKNHHSDTAR